MKVETHNHPTAIAPFPGASTGAGGEIRDEGATGRGSKPKAGLTGFTVSNLQFKDAIEPWESDVHGMPDRIASPHRTANALEFRCALQLRPLARKDRKSKRLNSSH